MNCLCNLFDDPTIWLIIIALILLFGFCGNGVLGNNNNRNCNGYGNGNGNGCGCGL